MSENYTPPEPEWQRYPTHQYPPPTGYWPQQGGYWPPPPPPPEPPRHGLRTAAVMIVALVAAAAIGVVVGRALWVPDRAAQQSPFVPMNPYSNGNNGGNPYGGSGGNSPGNTNSGGPSNVSSIAAQVDPGLVDINTTLGYEGDRAAGTGIVLTPNGEILTNNHVINGATSISVTDIGNGRTYDATVVGYDRTEDVAVIQLKGASGLRTSTLGDSNKVKVGDQIVAIGNAGGAGGTPSTAGGTVAALNQSITASDESDSSSERLTGLIQVNANVQPGDSGGPLVNSSGQVVGMDTAASTGFQFQSDGGNQSGQQGYAIPIDKVQSIARQITANQASSTIHIGPTGFLGVIVQATGRQGEQVMSGAAVRELVPGSPAEAAGLQPGDVITSLNGQPVTSPTSLTNLITATGDHPGDKVQLGWVDQTGAQQTSTVQLATGPAE